MNGSEIPSHLVSGAVWLQLKLGAPRGKSIRSSPRLCSIPPSPLFLITFPKTQPLVWVWHFPFRVHSLLTFGYFVESVWKVVRSGRNFWEWQRRNCPQRFPRNTCYVMFNRVRCHQHQSIVQMCHLYLNVKLWTELNQPSLKYNNLLTTLARRNSNPFCSGQVRWQCHIRIMPWSPSVAITSLPESSAVTAVESRCCRQHCEESCHGLAFEGHLWFFSLLSILKPPVFTLSISQAIFLTCFCNSFSLIPLIPSLHFICLSYRLLLFNSCVPVITCLSTLSTNNCLYRSSQFIGASDWTYNGVFVCVFISVFAIGPGVKIRSYRFCFFPVWFEPYGCWSQPTTVWWVD